MASRAQEDPHWRKRTGDAQEKRHRRRIVRLRVPPQHYSGEKTAPCLCKVDHDSGAVFAVNTSKAVSDYVIKAIVASVADWGKTD